MLLEGHTSIIYTTRLTPDSKTLITSGKDGKLQNWNLQTQTSTTLKTIPNGIYALTLSKTHPYIYTAGKGSSTGKNRLQKHNLKTGEKILNFPQGHTDSIFSIALSDSEKTLFTGGADNRIIGWCSETGGILKEFVQGHSDCVQFLVLSQNDLGLFSCGRDSRIIKWNVGSCEKLRIFEKGHSDWVGCLEIGRHGIFLFSGGGDKRILKWKANDGKLVCEFAGHDGGVYCVKLSPDGRFLFSGAADKIVFCWDVENRTVLKKLRGHQGQVRSIDVCPKFGFLVSGSKDKNVIKWEMGFLRNYRRLEKALMKDEKESVGQILAEEIDHNKDINELQEFVSLTSKADIEQTQLMSNRIICLIKEKLNSLQKNQNPEIIKLEILTYIDKLNKTNKKYNTLIKLIEHHGFTEKTLENDFLEIKLNKYLQEELEQYKTDSFERIAQLKEHLDEFITEDQKELQTQAEETYNFFQLEKTQNFKKFEGKLINGLKEGKVKEETYSGSIFEGTYKKGKRQGPGFLKTEKFSFEGDFENNIGLYNTGKITHFDPEGNSFEKQFKGVLNYLGDFQENTIYGKGEVFFRNKWSFRGTFYEDEINGAINGVLRMGGVERECTYGFFRKQKLGRFTTVDKIFSCDFNTGEILLSEER